MPRYVAVVPAAGVGARMGDAIPKQYLPIAGFPLLFHALRTLAADARIEQIFVVLAPGDRHFREMAGDTFGARVETLYCGGATRAASVYNGLLAVRDFVFGDDWVLVHDAARPCLDPAAVERLLGAVGEADDGGLLALPITDTVKRSDAAGRVLGTEPREALWQAQTPQMFRYGNLVEALRRAGAEVTDEAMAIERLGLKPRLVRGDPRNLKVTHPEDLALAELILRA